MSVLVFHISLQDLSILSTPSCSIHPTLVEDINFLVSRIIKLNSKLTNLEREHKYDKTHCQEANQVLLDASSVKVMATKFINVLIGMQVP